MKQTIIDGNCSTLIAGKNASETGYVLVAHGEDTSGVRSQTHLVPRKQHGKDEVVSFADGTAVIPQVPETNAYLWNEARVPGGESFADTFLNEYGVAVYSNNGLGSKIAEDGSSVGGIGYGFRKLIAERATSARHGVEIASELMEKYGYRSSRIYHIVDKEEAWSVQLTTGHQFAAEKVGDDEVYYLPNWYTIHQIDFNDTEHKKFYWSKDLVSYAIQQGWYQPQKEGDYSDFDFAEVYQDENGPSGTMINFDRSKIGWQAVTGGEEVPDKTFAIPAKKKYNKEDFKQILRIRYLDIHPEAVDEEYEPCEDVDVNKHYGITWHGSIEGSVIEFNEDPNLNCMWKTIDRQRHSIFMPIYYGIQEVPDGFEYIGEEASTASHFFVDEKEVRKFDKDSAFWAFHLLRDLMDFEFEEDKLLKKVGELENYFSITKKEVDQTYLKLKEENLTYAKELLTDYTNAMAQKAVKFVWDCIVEITRDKFQEKETRNF